MGKDASHCRQNFPLPLMTTAFAWSAAFSDRLKKACKDAGMERVGSGQPSSGYNVYSDETITVHAARKWLMGESIPA